MYRRFYKPRLTFIFIAICSIVFLAQPFIPFVEEYGFKPAYAFQRPWTFVTSIFLHGNFLHLFSNMFALFLFGIFLESRIGSGRFLIIFFVAGIFGNIGYLLTSYNSTIPAIGASGAVYGILGTLAVLHPTLIVWVGFTPLPIIVLAAIWLIMSILGLFSPPTGIAHEAHLAGLLIGIFYGIYLRKKY